MSQTKDVTIYDIAKALNVSAATVSRGLKDHPSIRKDTRKRILDAASKMGYQQNTFASNLRRKQTNTIGIIVPRLNSYFMSAVIAGMERVANNAGYNLIISQSQESVKKEIGNVTTMYNSRVDGLLVSLASDTQNTNHFETLLKRSVPLIFFDRVIEHSECTSIIINNQKAGYDATRHLVDQGCRRIVHVAGNLTCNVYKDRLNGYKQALTENDIKPNEAYIISNILSDEAGEEAAKQILDMKPLPDGIFTSNDISAVSCIRVLKEAGIKIPEQIAVIGFNNDPISKVIEPKLTTIEYPGEQMGEVAATTLIAKIKTPSASVNTIVLRHELIVRQSSQRK